MISFFITKVTDVMIVQGHFWSNQPGSHEGQVSLHEETNQGPHQGQVVQGHSVYTYLLHSTVWLKTEENRKNVKHFLTI